MNYLKILYNLRRKQVIKPKIIQIKYKDVMNLYSIIVVEDDSMQREILKTMIYSIYKSVNIYEADSEITALKMIEKYDINMFIIDIGLKESSGLNLAINIRLIPQYEFSQIIFLTTHIDYMLQAFKQTHCYDYILKPYDKGCVRAMLNKLISNEANKLKIENLEENREKDFVIRIKSGIFAKIKINKILFIEVEGRNCKVHTFDREYTYSNISLKKILKLIDCQYIIQSHKAFAINKKQIFKLEKVDVKLSIIHFESYSKTALLGYKFKNNIILEFKKSGNYHVE